MNIIKYFAQNTIKKNVINNAAASVKLCCCQLVVLCLWKKKRGKKEKARRFLKSQLPDGCKAKFEVGTVKSSYR